jgi:hypothetical protein
MKHRRQLARFLLVASVLSSGLVASPDPAAADFHLMKVREVFGGTSAEPNADFVELQMTATGQGKVSGQFLHIYDATGFRVDCQIPADVANQNQNARILFATGEFQALPDQPDPDFPLLHQVSGAGGAVCFANIDCVSWGSFSAETTSPAGTPFPGGIPPDQSIHRNPPSGDPPLDTDNSSTDFSLQSPPNPEANSASPTSQGGACVAGGAIVTKPSVRGLRAKVRGNRVTVTGRLRPPAPDERVALSLFADGSPLRKVAKKKDELNADSRFKKRLRVPSESTRCKVKVAFHGRTVGKKKFAC